MLKTPKLKNVRKTLRYSSFNFKDAPIMATNNFKLEQIVDFGTRSPKQNNEQLNHFRKSI